MGFFRLGKFFVFFLVLTLLAFSAFLIYKNFGIKAGAPLTKENVEIATNEEILETVEEPKLVLAQKMENTPKIIKAVYVTGYSAGRKSYLDYLANLVDRTEINAAVIDIKDSEGNLSYLSGVKEMEKYRANNFPIKDIDFVVNFLHAKNIYVIGRMPVFQDSLYAKDNPEVAIYDKRKATQGQISANSLWYGGGYWLDPASKKVWDYNISLAKDAFMHGFDEINFDYVRFPSDGIMANMGFPVWNPESPMSYAIGNFFKYLRKSLPHQKLSVDLFGLTTVFDYDMGIGQILEDALENFDYVSPMVYPSHYAPGFIGFENPAEHPYEVVKYSMERAKAKGEVFLQKKEKMTEISSKKDLLKEKIKLALFPNNFHVAKLRPWLQDFNMGAYYTNDMVKAQIRAVEDALKDDFNGFMLWSPYNVYSEGAVLKPVLMY